MKKNIVIVQRIIPHYRKEFYKKLAQELNHKNIKLYVLHSSSNVKNDNIFCYIKPMINIYLSNLRETTVFSPSLYQMLKKINPKLILSEGISNLPNGIIILLFCKFNKIKYGITGLGKILGGHKKSFLKNIFRYLADYFRNKASFFISYSETGISYYNKFSSNCVSYYNSIINSHLESYKLIRNKYNTIEPFNIIFVGRIEPQKRLTLLINTLNSITSFNITLNIIGEGSKLQECKSIVTNNNIKIKWYGKVTDINQKQDIYKNMHLGIMPGSGGLVIQELQAYAIPVIASYSDGTEIDLVKNINPELFIEKIDKEELIKKIFFFIKSSSEQKVLMAENAFNITKEKYNLNNMIQVTYNKIISEII